MGSAESLTALILAGGKGSRLAPWPAPKAILPVNGVPMIHRLMNHISPDVGRIITCVGYRADDLAACVLGWNGKNRVMFSNAGEDAKMCDRLLKARKEFGIEGRALVLYGDELGDVNIKALEQQHAEERERWGLLMTMTTFRQRLPFGIWKNGKIDDNVEVDVNIGFAVVEPFAWDYATPFYGLSDFFNALTCLPDGCTGVTTFEHKGRRTTINNLAELETAEEVWK